MSTTLKLMLGLGTAALLGRLRASTDDRPPLMRQKASRGRAEDDSSPRRRRDSERCPTLGGGAAALAARSVAKTTLCGDFTDAVWR